MDQGKIDNALGLEMAIDALAGEGSDHALAKAILHLDGEPELAAQLRAIHEQWRKAIRELSMRRNAVADSMTEEEERIWGGAVDISRKREVETAERRTVDAAQAVMAQWRQA